MSVTRRLALAAIVAAGAATGWGSARADWRDELPVFRIGILGGELVDLQLKDHACLKARAEKALGVPVQLFASRDYSGLTEGLLAGRLDTALLGAAGYASIYLQKPDAVEPIVTVEEKDGTLGYRSVLLVRADSPYQTIDDLRGRTLVFTERLSTSGFPDPLLRAEPAGLRSQPVLRPTRLQRRPSASGGRRPAAAGRRRRDLDLGHRRPGQGLFARQSAADGRSWRARHERPAHPVDLGADSRPTRRSCARICRRKRRRSIGTCCSIWPSAIGAASSAWSAARRRTSRDQPRCLQEHHRDSAQRREWLRILTGGPGW